MRPQLKLFLLGAPRVELDGEHLEVRPRKALALLIYLAVTANRHTRDALATLLWPNSDQRRGHRALSNRLSELNLTLGGDWIEADRESVGLRAGCWLDLTEFQHCLEEDTDDSQRLITAVNLYRDDFLTGFTLRDCPAFDEWQFFQGESVRQTLASALEKLVGLLSNQAEYDAAIPHARRWLALDPLHEPAYRQLMQLYTQMGQQAAALRQYEICRQTLNDELGISPSEETTGLYKAIRSGKAEISPSISSPRHNLPAQTTPFIGQERELMDLRGLLDDPATRLVTILAPGGMGKTRLALEAAKNHLESGQDRVCFVELAPLTAGEDIVSAIADATAHPFQQDDRSPEQQLIEYLREKQMLLALDNFEHLLERVDLVNKVLQAAPQVTVLVTSRERLQLSGETVYALDGMEFPNWEMASLKDEVEDLLEYNAIKLFMQCAQRVRPDFVLEADDLTYVARICRLVQGMPLGILLSAAWVDLLSPQEIANEISQSIDFLETELRDVPDRQRSIRAVFEHSWRRLDEAERSVFMKLSVFRGGFTRVAAQSVAQASLRSLSALLNKSLLQREPNGRYTIHELLRQYAGAELEASEQVEETWATHSSYFLDFLAGREADLKGPRQKAAVDEIEADFENIRNAWTWSVERTQAEQVGQAIESLGLIYEWFGRFQEGEQIFARAVDRLAGIEAGQRRHILVNILIWQARFGEVLGMNKQARRLLRQSLALLETPTLATQDIRLVRASILVELGRVANSVGNHQEAERLYEEGLVLYRSTNDRWGEARALLALSTVNRERLEANDPKHFQQQAEISEQLVLKSLATFRKLGDRANTATGLQILGLVYLTLGQATAAQMALQECIAICNDLGSVNNKTLIAATGYLGAAKEHLGLYQQMRDQGHSALALARELGFSHGIFLGLYLMGCAAMAEKRYQEAQQLLQENVALCRRERPANLAFSLICLGFATYYGQNSTIEVRQQLVEVLQIVLETRLVRATPNGLLLAALLLADQGNVEQAVELKALAWSFPFIANSRWCEDLVGQHITAAATALPTDVVAAAQARGQARDLWATMEELLATFIEDEPAGG